MRHAERMPDMAIAYKRSARHWAEGLPWQSPQLPIPDNAPPSRRLVLEPHSWKESLDRGSLATSHLPGVTAFVALARGVRDARVGEGRRLDLRWGAQRSLWFQPRVSGTLRRRHNLLLCAMARACTVGSSVRLELSIGRPYCQRR